MKHTFVLSLILVLSVGIVSPMHAQIYLTKCDSYYKYGYQTIQKSEISHFLKENCPEAYKQYHNPHLKAGWGVCVPSIAMLISGAVMSFSGASDNIIYAGIGLGAAGAAGIIASTPLLIIGYDKRRSACSVFNSRCSGYASASPLLLNLNVGPQSLGMALCF